MKHMNAREICADMNDTLGADCIGHSIVTKYFREKCFSKSMFDADNKSKIEDENFIDGASLGALEKCPFSSLRRIPKRILIPMSIARDHLANSLGYQIKNIRWVPHSLSSSQKQALVEMSQDLLQVLRLAKHHAWKYFATLDEAWFYFSNHLDWIWLPHDELPSSLPKHTIASQKLMMTAVWNPHGFHVIQSLPKGIK
jgi:hypothetical protein